MIEELVRAKIAKLPLVQQLCAARVFSKVAPQDAILPYITYDLLTRYRVKDLQGDTGLGKPTYGITCWGINESDVRNLALAIQQSEGPSSGIAWTVMDDETDDFQASIEQDEQGIRSVTVEIAVWHQGR